MLVEEDGSKAGDVDMAVGGKQRDQGKQRAGKKSDPALKVE